MELNLGYIFGALTIAFILGFVKFLKEQRKCVTIQARKIALTNKAIKVVLDIIKTDTLKNHPDSNSIKNIDKIYEEITEDEN